MIPFGSGFVLLESIRVINVYDLIVSFLAAKEEFKMNYFILAVEFFLNDEEVSESKLISC